MSGEKNGKNTIWLYAVILFTSAFIVLLLTAISQIKFNKNIDEYKNQILIEESAKNNIQINLGTVLSENKKLNEKLKDLMQENEDLKIKVDEANKLLNKQQQKSSAYGNAYDMLINAQAEYNNGNIINCADILYSKIDSKLLGKTGVEIYNDLADKVFVKAAKILYIDGYKNYIDKNYETAINFLKKSYEYTSYEYFSDDCLYFTAYSYYRLGNINEVKVYMQKIVDIYPNSSYMVEAVNLIKEIE